jgi:hypothetical protein
MQMVLDAKLQARRAAILMGMLNVVLDNFGG